MDLHTSVGPMSITFPDGIGTIEYAPVRQVVNATRFTEAYPPKGQARKRIRPPNPFKVPTSGFTHHGEAQLMNPTLEKTIEYEPGKQATARVIYGYYGLGTDGAFSPKARAWSVGADIYGDILREPSLDVLMSKLRSKMADTRNNLALTFAELTKTKNMLYNGVKQTLIFAQDCLAAKRGNRRALRRIYRRFGTKGKPPTMKQVMRTLRTKPAQAWLVNAYGIVPFIADIQDYAKSLAEFANGDRVFTETKRLAVGSDLDVTLHGKQRSAYDPYGYFPIDIAEPVHFEISQKVKTRLVVHATPDIRREIEGEYLGIRSPAAAVQLGWELTPFSMLVDYFIDIGGYLQQIDATSGWAFGPATHSVSSVHKGGEEGVMRFLSVRKERNVVDIYMPPPRSLGLKTPRGTQLANTIALLQPLANIVSRSARFKPVQVEGW